jgi:hypothetical protein
VLEHERPMILTKAHIGIARGNYVGKETMQNSFCVGIWWPTLHKYAKEYYQACSACQRVGNPSRRVEMPLHP